VLNVFAEKGSFPAQLEGIATVRTSARDPETRVIQTEILSMELTGNIKIGHPRRDVPIKLKIGRSFGLPPSTGRIIPITPRAVFPATNFFDVFTQIELEGRVLHNEFPIRMDAIIFNNEVNPPFTAVDVFGTEFELVESAGGAEAAYTGLNYVFQDFWEFLEDDE